MADRRRLRFLKEDAVRRRMLAGAIALVLFTTACAPRYQRMTLPVPALAGNVGERSSENAAAQDAWRRLARQLPPAAIVRLQLADGTRLTAVVLVADDDAIVVKPKTRIPEPQRRIPYSTIESLELDTGRGIGAWKAAAIGVGTGAATFVTLLLLTIVLLDD
jgi:hypothetical protein